MKTKKVTLSRATASFSTAASHVSTVTLARAPWDTEPDPEPEATADDRLPREPRHLGPYKRDRKA